MREDLINDLRSVDDSPPPVEAMRYVAHYSALCNESADAIEQLLKVNTALADSLKWVNEDPYIVLSRINVNDHVEKKNGLSYLSWAWAWDTLMSIYPNSYTQIRRPENMFPYWTDGHTCWVDVSVTIVWNGTERTRSEVFPIMNYKNQSIPAESVTSFDVNTALQRAWTKCIARHGLGFYIYAGQDLPNEEAEAKRAKEAKLITSEQAEKVYELYSTEEIQTMLKRLKKSALGDVTQAQAEKMIAKRDRTLLNEEIQTF